MDWNARWITPAINLGDVCPVFKKRFSLDGDCALNDVKCATLYITAKGVYEARLNGERIGDYILAPGWTFYERRLQYQEYNVTDLLTSDNLLEVTVGKGWYRGGMPGWKPDPEGVTAMLVAQLTITLKNGSVKTICTDESWSAEESKIRYSEIYHGETFDASFEADKIYGVNICDGPFHTLIPQQGEEIKERERLFPARIFTTPRGETVIDFGQEITGYVEINVNANEGDTARLSHAETLDKDGNFYNENYRGAKALYTYICRAGAQTYKPKMTFYGFRFVRIDAFPGGAENAKPENFTAIAVYSDMRRTGRVSTGNLLLNRFIENAVWGQKGNFLDVPTDCPQRDERLGWTGDAQAFVRTACLNFDVERFFTKWLADMSAGQHDDGMLDHTVPAVLKNARTSAAWGDAATICPWEIYIAYGNKDILKNQFNCMKKWVDYISTTTSRENLWTGGSHFGDWLALDVPQGTLKGASRDDFIASAFYARSTDLLVKTGKIIGQDVSEYEALSQRIHKAFRQTYNEYNTQTECVLAAYFNLTDDCQAAADKLAELIIACGNHLQTGFVGVPYLLYVLSEHGYLRLAYDLLLRTEYPSWLYPVTKGATTVWEHWDGIMEDGSFWNKSMNSFNHYAYGAVLSWIYNVAAGINPVESDPGYAKIKIEPHPDRRLGYLKAEFNSRRGTIRSSWELQERFWRFEIETPSEAEIIIGGETYKAQPGQYLFFSPVEE